MVFGAAGKSVIASKGSSNIYTVTEGNFFNFYGYADDLITVGSVDSTDLKGKTVSRLGYDTGSGYFQLYIAGSHPQDFFDAATPQDGIRVLSSAADVFTESGGFTQWAWTQSKPARWDGAGTSTVVIEY